MAISEVHYRLLETLRDEGKLPQKCDLLEIGEANWYGDIDPSILLPMNGCWQERLLEIIAGGMTGVGDARTVALAVYQKLMGIQKVVAIDQASTTPEWRRDLNNPIDVGGDLFGIVMNHGTAEHVFNIANVFKVAHDHCEVGGLMIHESPWRGWPDHGFYCLQPTLFWDIAFANNYRVELFAGEDITNKKSIRFESREQLLRQVKTLPENLCLFVVYRKLFEQTFKVPQQHVYTPWVSEETRKAWAEMR